jgi:hypothetical protein
MRHFCIAFFLVLFLPTVVMAQKKAKIKVEEGEYTLKVEENVSVREAEKKARELAQINAIENAFGKVIMQGNSTFIQNTNTGDKAETVNVFNFVSDSYVNGEWIETISEKLERKYDDKNVLWIIAKVKGKIREIVTPNPGFEFSPLSCPEVKCKTTAFNNGQDVFLYFKSSQNGYLSVYLDDPQMNQTFRILPYQKLTGSYAVNLPVDQDKPYIFFSKQTDAYNNPSAVDNILIEVTKPTEIYKLFIVFSPEPFDKPLLTDKNKELQSQADKQKNYFYPKSLESIEFQKWLQNIRIQNPRIEVQSTQITAQK